MDLPQKTLRDSCVMAGSRGANVWLFSSCFVNQELLLPPSSQESTLIHLLTTEKRIVVIPPSTVVNVCMCVHVPFHECDASSYHRGDSTIAVSD
jgi:hypothetical protein